MKENNVNERLNAYYNIHMGKEAVANENVVSALTFFRHALYFFREASQLPTAEEIIAQDTRDIQDTLSQLIEVINTLVNSSIDANIVINELERFLTFYVGTYKALNEKTQRLPGLTELNLQDLSQFWKKLSNETDKARVEIYLAIITLFHDEIVSQKSVRARAKDPAVVKKAIALFQRALAIAPQPEPESEPAPPPQPVVAPLAPPPKKVRFASDVHSDSRGSPKYTPGFGIFANIAADEPKREALQKMKAEENYEGVIKCHAFMINKTVEDYRCVGFCHEMLGKKYFGQKNHVLALENFKHALQMCKHAEGLEPLQDITTKKRLIDFCFQAIQSALSQWHIKYGDTVKAVGMFFSIYLENFVFIAKGLDELAMNAIGARNQEEKNFVDIFSVVIALFSQSTRRGAGWLGRHIAACEAMKNLGEPYVVEIYGVFKQALNAARYPVRKEVVALINPEFRAQVEAEQKQAAGQASSQGSSSSSSLRTYSNKK